MTKLHEAVVIRELGVAYRGKPLIIELHGNFIRYRLKGAKIPLTDIEHVVAVAAGQKVEARERGIKI